LNYQKIHDQIILKAQNSGRRRYKTSEPNYQYFELHHIIPKCLGGSNKKENLVFLTAREHFLIHRLLVEIYPENNGINYAFWTMCNAKNEHQKREYKISSRVYEDIRKKVSIITTKLHTGKIITEEKIRKQKETRSKKSKEELQEIVDRIFESYKNNPENKIKSKERGLKRRGIPGVPHSQETKRKIKEAREKRTPEQIAETKRKFKENWESKTEEERQVIIKKRSEAAKVSTKVRKPISQETIDKMKLTKLLNPYKPTAESIEKGLKTRKERKHLHKSRVGIPSKKKGIKSGRTGKAKAVLQFTLSNEFIKEFYSCREVNETLGFTEEDIRLCCVGKRKTSAGFKWEYKEENK
jgi:hypothetical protein